MEDVIIKPGSGARIGLLTAGQLERMTALAAFQKGLNISCYSPESTDSVHSMTDQSFVGAFTDWKKLREFAAVSDIITCTFENVPTETLSFLQEVCGKPVRPGPRAFNVAQIRSVEKCFAQTLNISTTHFDVFHRRPTRDPSCGFPGFLKSVFCRSIKL